MSKFIQDMILHLPSLYCSFEFQLSSSNIKSRSLSSFIIPRREAIKFRKPKLTIDPISRETRVQGVAQELSKKYRGRYNRELFSQSSDFVHLRLADGRWYKIEGYIATAYRRSDRSYIPVAGRSLSIQTGVPFGVFWMIQSVRTINNHAYRHGLPAPSETRNKLIRHRWRMAATHCNTHLKGFSTADRRSIEMETSMLFAPNSNSRIRGGGETKRGWVCRKSSNLWLRGGWCSSTFRCNDHSCYFKSCGDRVEMRLYPREYKSRRINWNKHLKRTVWRFVQLISLLIESLYQIALVPADCPRGNDGTNESGDSNSITKFLSTCIQRVQRHERHMRPVFETDSNCWNMRADIYVVTYVFYLVEGGRGETREGNNNSRVNASLGPCSFA